MKKVIEVENLEKSYKSLRALDGISFDVNEGEILGLLGPNGSGKSTTINCLLSLLSFDKGQVKIFGKEMRPGAYDIKSKIGVVFQDVAVFDELTVYENIDYFCGLYISDKIKRKDYVMEAINLVSIGEFKDFRPKQLSGGLLRRLNIACGVAHKPSLIFLDEPTVAVDPQSRNNILEGIKKLNSNGATVVYTTHYMEEVEQLCNRIIIIDKGKIIAEGTKEELKSLVNIEEKITVELDKELNENIIDDMSSIKHVSEVCVEGRVVVLSYRKGTHNLSNLIDYMKDNGISYNRIYSELPTLNDVFLNLTGKELRD
jgi:ABC-2 type transport system ATP-binding protein